MLGDLGVLEVLEYTQELNALVLHPLHRVAGHVEPAADQLCVGTPVGILHEEVEGVILGVVVGHGLLLELGLNGKEGHAHVGCAADGAGLLKYNNGAAAGGVQGLLGLGCSAEAGHAAAYENNIGFNMFHLYILLKVFLLFPYYSAKVPILQELFWILYGNLSSKSTAESVSLYHRHRSFPLCTSYNKSIQIFGFTQVSYLASSLMVFSGGWAFPAVRFGSRRGRRRSRRRSAHSRSPAAEDPAAERLPDPRSVPDRRSQHLHRCRG